MCIYVILGGLQNMCHSLMLENNSGQSSFRMLVSVTDDLKVVTNVVIFE